MRTRHATVSLGVLLLGAAVVPAPAQPAAASCAAPRLKLDDRAVLMRDTTVTVEGRGFVDGCQDSGGCTEGVGCHADRCSYGPEPQPLDDVTLVLSQRGRTWEVGTVDAEGADDEHLGWTTWTFEVPAGAKPGPARLGTEESDPAIIRIR